MVLGLQQQTIQTNQVDYNKIEDNEPGNKKSGFLLLPTCTIANSFPKSHVWMAALQIAMPVRQ
jgi:hypothetical protein